MVNLKVVAVAGPAGGAERKAVDIRAVAGKREDNGAEAVGFRLDRKSVV